MSLRDEVLDKIDIVDLVARYVDIKKVGKNWAGLCPFHKEKSPSFTVAEDKQIFKCFGCGKGGNAITFHMEVEKIDFIDSLKILAEDAHIDVKQFDFNPGEAGKRQEEKEKYKLLNKRVQGFFADQFAGSVAERYARDARKLDDETLKVFGIGYGPDSHYDLIKVMKEKGFESADLVTAGVAKKGKSGDVYAFFRQRMTFPIHDHISNIVGFGGRALDKDQNPKYLNTTETPLYDKSKILYGLNHARDHVKEREHLIVVEGYMDVIALYQYGYPIGVATCGTALTQQHTKILRRHSENIIFAFDNDNAGFEAVIRGLKVAYEQDLFPKVLAFPQDYKDVDEWLTATNTKLDKEALKKQSIDGFTFVLRGLQEKYDLMNPVERKRVLTICFEILAPIQDRTILSLYFDTMSKPFGTGADVLLQQFKGFSKKKRTSNFQAYEDPKEEDESRATKYLLAALRYNDFIQEHAAENLQGYIELIPELATYFPGSILGAALNKDLSDEQHQKILESQLRRDTQLTNLAQDKKDAVLKRFFQNQIAIMQRIILKSKKLNDEQKATIMAQVKKLAF